MKMQLLRSMAQAADYIRVRIDQIERLLMFVTGMQNIRDVIPFARTPGSCEF